ncbi:hypothetical protein [Sinorhizobium meliloti]|uniref:hypothetical protein n=1 Tax=Rhizobium meliloti TaxID=382 RepID=UPI0001E4BFC3|nr:hypothetical protein [Sinorhizobium meliloti]AEG04119.1 hypothetical protein SinmeB_1193 [Sinorhizobium meliloti BL225C]ASP70537.1 hypothetical protein CDO28_02565 [Sinorhizobium meliloti]MDE3828919.1 hypothetical protein [Sinorhizobium meliloti]MDE3854994.1 hypothetical protein [Sinorhizobium meliloti]MDE4545061.1 hypothetical protein [Sinorhizobium meliloti]
MKSSNTVIGLLALGRLTTLCRLKSTTALRPGEYRKDSQQEASEDSPTLGQLHGGSGRTIGIPSHEQRCWHGIQTAVDTGNAMTFTQHQSKIIRLLEGVRPPRAWCNRAAKPACLLMAKEKIPPKLQTAINCALTFVRANGQSHVRELDLQGRWERALGTIDDGTTGGRHANRARKIAGPDLTFIRF